MRARSHVLLGGALSVFFLSGVTPSAAAVIADCIHLKDTVDKALCTSPDAKAADDGMVQSYAGLKAGIDRTAAASLLKNQRTWLADRKRTCPENGETEAACVIRWSNARRDWFNGTPAQGPGLPGALAPLIIDKDGAKGHWSQDIALFRFKAPTTPGEVSFNAAVDKAVAGAPDRMDGAGEGEHGTWSLKGTLAWVSPDFISMRVDAAEFAEGAAHGMTWTQNINIDLRTGQPVVINNIIAEAKLRELDGTCLSQIRTQLANAYKDNGSDIDKDAQAKDELKADIAGMHKDVAIITADATHWTFGRDGVVISYDQDALAAHAAGSFECRIPLAQLQAVAKVPLPFH